ncbi:MAG: GNAT family N-acetyltransferase, partial [Sporomusa sp.]
MPYANWLIQLKRNGCAQTVNPDWVVSSTFLALHHENIVGMIDIRHTLNPFLRESGGHIGYGVRPIQRGKGYATQMLRMGLKYCRQLSIPKVMLACNKDNLA